MKIQHRRKYIITGAPATGKTSLLEALAKRGYPIKAEIARKVIRQELALESTAVPWLDIELFSDKVFAYMWAELPTYHPSEIIFLDRAVPDIIAYLHFAQKNIPPKYAHSLTDFGYATTVFLAPIWEEIYLNDTERKESFIQAKAIEEALINTYTSLGFKVITLPKSTISKRVEFITHFLAQED